MLSVAKLQKSGERGVRILPLLLIISACCLCSCTTLNLKPQAPVSTPQQTPKAQSEAPVAAPPPASISAESYRKILMAADLAFSRACEDKGAAEAFYENLAPDGVCLLTGDTPIEGRDAAKVRFSSVPTEALTWKPRQAEVSAAADLGYTWGLYESKITSQDKAAVTTSGKYAIIWKRQSDGGWKAELFMTSAVGEKQ
jgi:ketosteroid isomerase-like protein